MSTIRLSLATEGMAKQEFSTLKLTELLRTEADAYLLLEKLRWGGGPDACPKCGEVGRCV